MRDFIRIFKHNEKEFKSGGIGVIQNARDVCISQNTAGDYHLEFTLHPSDPKMKFLNPENICALGGQLFRIKTVEGDKVSAVAVYNDAAYHHIQMIDDMIGKSPYEIMVKIFDGTPVKVISEEAVRALGMEWVTDLTDFFAVSKVTPLGAMKNLTDTLEKYRHHCEVYIDNYSIALVKQIGADKGARLDTAYNAKEITVKRDASELITRLYPYGKDDLHIGSVNGGVQYIDSENYSIWPREGYQDYDEIEDPNELLESARWALDSENPDRIDLPKYSITANYAQRKDKEIMLGDIVTVIDRDYGVTSKQRVIEVKTYPFEPNKNEVTVGTPIASVATVFNGIAESTVKYENSTNSKGEVKPSFLENLAGSYSTEVNKKIASSERAKRKTVIHDYGDIWVNPENKNQALALIGGVMAMANAKNADGDWNWTAFGDWTGFTASVINAGILNTSKVMVKSEDGNTQLSGNLLKMYDTNGTIRLRMGQDSGSYVFTLFDSLGNAALSLNSDGGLEMKGALNTTIAEEGKCGYYISDEDIRGWKFKNGKFILHGICATSDKYGSHFMMYVDGEKAFHMHSFEEGGVRKTAYAVNNTTDKEMSWRAFDIAEGAEYATTRCYGDWDVSSMTFIQNGKVAVTGDVSGGGISLNIENGLIMGATGMGNSGYTGVFTVENKYIYVNNGIITDVQYSS